MKKDDQPDKPGVLTETKKQQPNQKRIKTKQLLFKETDREKTTDAIPAEGYSKSDLVTQALLDQMMHEKEVQDTKLMYIHALRERAKLKADDEMSETVAVKNEQQPVEKVAEPAPVKEPVDQQAVTASPTQRLTLPAAPEKTALVGELQSQADQQLSQLQEDFSQQSESPLTAGQQKINRLKQRQNQVIPATAKVNQAIAAVDQKPADQQGITRAAQTEHLNQLTPPVVEKSPPETLLKNQLKVALPQNLEQVTTFAADKKAGQVGDQVTQLVEQQMAVIPGTYEQVQINPKTEAPQKGKSLPDMEKAPQTPAMNLSNQLVSNSPGKIDLSGYQAATGQLLQKEGLSPQELSQVDSGPLLQANQHRSSIQKQVDQAPATLKSSLSDQTQKASRALNQAEKAGRQQMAIDRHQILTATQNQQTQLKKTEEARLAKHANAVNQIYEQLKNNISQQLNQLTEKSQTHFQQTQHQAALTFQNQVQIRIDAYKKERYSGIGSPFRWAKDKLMGIDQLPLVKTIIETEKASYLNRMNTAIAQITQNSQKTITRCQDMISQGHREIQQLNNQLPTDLKNAADQIYQGIQVKFRQLNTNLNRTARRLKQQLANQRKKALKAIDQKLHQLKTNLGSLLSQVRTLVTDGALKFMTWALEKAGYQPQKLLPILQQSQLVLSKVVQQPVTFMKNLATAAGSGIHKFQANIKQHLKQGLFSWLTGAVGDLPIQIPEKMDLKGIISLSLQILGATWENLRQKLVKRIGEPAVQAAEKGITLVKKLVTEGPLALYELVKDQALLIKEMVITGIQQWTITALIKKGFITLLSFLNPAGAVVQAILAIYNGIMFFIENRSRIAELTKTILGSIKEIALGKINTAATFIESTLARTVPIIISFLAHLLNLKGISQAISNLVQKIRKPIDKAVNKTLDVITKKARTLKIKPKIQKDNKIQSTVLWSKIKKKFQLKNGENHTLAFDKQGNKASLVIYSKKFKFSDYLIHLSQKFPSRGNQITEIRNIASEIKTISRLKVEPKEAKTLTNKMTLLSLKIIDIYQSDASSEFPEKPIRAFPKRGTAIIKYLSTKSSKGGIPTTGTENVPGMSLLTQYGLTNSGDKWVRMHLISHKIGGTNDPQNLIPAPNSVNRGARVYSFETALNRLVQDEGFSKPNLIWVYVNVSQWHPEETINKPFYQAGIYPKSINMKAGFYRLDKKSSKRANYSDWKMDTKKLISEYRVPVPKPNFNAGDVPNLSYPSRTAFKALNYDGADVIFSVITIQRIRQAADGKEFSSIKDFENKLRAIKPTNQQWQNKVDRHIIIAVRNLIKNKQIILN